MPGAEVLLKAAKSISVKDEGDSGSDSDDWVDVDESGDELHISTDDDEDDSDKEENSDEEVDEDGEDANESGTIGSGEEEEVDSDEEELDSDEEEEVDSDEEDEEEDEEEEVQEEEEEEKEAGSVEEKNGEENEQQKKQPQKSPKAKTSPKATKKQRKLSISQSVTSEASTSKKAIKILNEKAAAQEIAMTRIFTDEDYVRIDAQNIKKQVSNARKRPLEAETSEYVKLNDIEMIFKKRRNDKNSRFETVMRGREDREKFGYRDKRANIHCSKTNAEKSKKKNFGMMRVKARSKVKKSFKEKQHTMRQHLLRQKKMK